LVYIFIVKSTGFVHGKHEGGWITISVDEYESMKSTIETLSSPEAMNKILKGEKELSEGKGKSLKQVKKEFGL
jgi:PHD/YefM family antitoxin component YafN of YafNO toxin-antitoxin module